MSDNMNGPLDLGTNPQEVDTQAPVLVEGTYKMAIAKAEVIDAPPEKEQSHNLRVQFQTQEAAKSTNGQDIQPGYPVTRTYPLTTSWERDIARLVDAALHTTKGTRPPTWAAAFQQLPGRQLLVRLTVRDSEQYGLQNDVRGYDAIEPVA